MSRQSRRARRSQKKQGAMLPMVLVAAVVLIIAGAMYLLDGDDIDPITSCPEGGPASVTAVIIDTSDPLGPHQIAAFEKFTESLIKSPESGETVTVNSDSHNYVQKGHMLAAYELADQSGQPRLLFEYCNPGDPDERAVKEKLTEGEILARIRWSKFTQELAAAFPKETLGKTAPTSPIIETIRYVRRDKYPSSSELKASGQRAGTIFIISDMLQNSDRLSHFSSELPAVENVPSEFALDLTGIDVGIRYLKFDKYSHLQQGARPHFTWWRQFFAIAGSPLRLPPDVW